MSVFIIEHLYKSYQSKDNKIDVLKDVNLQFPDSGLVSIVGKSGCGKSTLLNILMGIEKPSKGRVLFDNKEVQKFTDTKFSDYHLSSVSLVFQHYNLFEDLTALDNAILPLLIRGESKKIAALKAIEYFKDFGIENLSNKKVKNLSGGEKQRVAITRCLLINPKVILCDEPTGALDDKNSEQIMNILKSISNRRLVIIVSHNQNLVVRYSDQIITLKDGRVIDIISSTKKHFSNTFNKKKYRYSSRWFNKFFFLNFKKNILKNIFSSFCCVLGFTSILLSFGFVNGSTNSENEAVKKSLASCFSTVSFTEFITLENSPLIYEKTLRPSIEQIENKIGSFKSILVENNLSYFISNFASYKYENKNFNNIRMIPYYNDNLTKNDSLLLQEGTESFSSFNEIIVNTEFIKLLNINNPLSKEISIASSSEITYSTNDKNIPFIKDSFSFNSNFKIVGVVEEFSFLNSPKIYYSYKKARDLLKQSLMINLSAYLGKNMSFYRYLDECLNDDPISSYSYNLFLTDINEFEEFDKLVNSLIDINDPIQIESDIINIKATYRTFINSFSSALIIFILIAFLGINFIIGMVSLSSFIEKRKETAILTCLGSKNSTIYNLFLLQNYIVVIVSFIISIILSIWFQPILNNILFKKFYINNLIKIPLINFLNFPFWFTPLLIFIYLIFSTIFTFIPMSIYRHRSLSDELRDE